MDAEFVKKIANAVDKFNEDGCVVIEDFLTDEEVSAAKSEMAKIVANMKPEDHPTSVFTTTNESQHVADGYFLNSVDKISFFYEAGAHSEEGELKIPKEQALNKVGHALHVLNPTFRRISFSEKIKHVLRVVGYKKPELVQSMYIFKQPRIGGEVTPHTDATFLQIEPIEHLIGLWFPIDDATLDNGCLHFIPGSHKRKEQGPLTYRFVRTHQPDGPLLKFVGEKPKVDDDSAFVAAPIKKGGCVLIHGLVVHKSERNTSDKPRHAYTLHIVDRENTTWSPNNWLQETEDYHFPNVFSTKP